MSPDLDALLDEAIKSDNIGFRKARKPGVILAIHLCRGNNRSHWYAQGGYDAIAEKLFNQLDVDRFLLEYDDERSGTFEPLRFVPKGKIVVLGMISTKSAARERGRASRSRSTQAAKYFRSSTWHSVRSAGSRRCRKAICSRKTSSGRR